MLRAKDNTQSSNLPLVCEDDSSLLRAFHALYSSITMKNVIFKSYICLRQRASAMPVLCMQNSGTTVCKFKVATYTYQIATCASSWVSKGHLWFTHHSVPFLNGLFLIIHKWFCCKPQCSATFCHKYSSNSCLDGLNFLSFLF